MNKIIQTLRIILFLSVAAAQPLGAQLRIPTKLVPRNNSESIASYDARFLQIKKSRDFAQYFLSQPSNSGGKHVSHETGVRHF